MANYKRIFMDGYRYYITMVTHQRKPILIDNIDLLRDSFRRTRERYRYRIDAIIVLPDHLHMIITPQKASDYPKIISHIKRSFVYGMNASDRNKARQTLSASSYRRKLAGVWQKRFYEHTIRDEKDMLEKMIYIQNNALNHGLAEEWNEWKYSSFRDM